MARGGQKPQQPRRLNAVPPMPSPDKVHAARAMLAAAGLAPLQGRKAQLTAAATGRRQRAARNAANNQANAALSSIPRGPAKTKEELFTKGALKSFQFAPRGHGYYDAFVQKPDSATVAMTTGPATVVTGHTTHTVIGGSMISGTFDDYSTEGSATPSNYYGNATLVLINPGSSDKNVGITHTIMNVRDPTTGVPTGAVQVKTNYLFCTQFEGFGTAASGPKNLVGALGDRSVIESAIDPTRDVAQIPLRGSLRIRNITEALAVGGLVRVLRFNGGMQINTDPAGSNHDSPNGVGDVGQFMKLCDMVRDSSRTKTLSGHELRAAHQSNSYPADFVKCMAFENNIPIAEAIARPGYCTLVYLIEDYASSSAQVNNTYEININVQRAARYGPGTLLAGMSRELTVKPHPQGEAHAPAALPV